MSYPVRLIGGTDNLIIPGDPRTYQVGEVIDNLSDHQRATLQGQGLRFEALQPEEAPEAPAKQDVAPPPADPAPEPPAPKAGTRKDAQ